MELISLYRLTIPAQTPCGTNVAIETVLCPACASREQFARQLVRPAPTQLCSRCGLDGLQVRPIRIADMRGGLDQAVMVACAQLLGQPTSWFADLEAAYTWLISFTGPILTDGHIVLLPSDSSDVIYSVNDTCQCKAYSHRQNARKDRACKHRVRAKLLKRAIAAQEQLAAEPVGHTIRALAPAAPAYLIPGRFANSGKSAQAEADELFPS